MVDASVTLISDLQSIVLIRRVRRASDPWSGDMAFPGGFIKKGESQQQAAARECLEEIGFLPSNLKFFGVYETMKNAVKVAAFTDLESIPDHLEPGPEVSKILVVRLKNLMLSRNESGFSCYLAGVDEIWGLTFRILSDFIERFYTH